MSIDHKGENVASCSIDGRVCVRGLLSSSEPDFSANLNKPVRAVSIDPVYFRSDIFISTYHVTLSLFYKGWPIMDEMRD